MKSKKNKLFAFLGAIFGFWVSALLIYGSYKMFLDFLAWIK